MSSEFLADIY